ncbi:MAG: hypothetical protein U0235_28080 [Polyangiaceae bacterium]
MRSGASLTSVVVCALGLAACVRGPAAFDGTAPTLGSDLACAYDVTISPSGKELDVVARFAPGVLDGDTAATVTEGAEPFVRELTSASGARPPLRSGTFSVSDCARGCSLRYRFALADAADALGDDSVARATRGALEAPFGTWLLRPTAHRESDRFSLVVHSPSGRFVTGFAAASEPTPGEYRTTATLADLARAPYTLFGSLAVTSVPLTRGAVTLAVAGGARPSADFPAWVRRASDAVTANFGRFPVDSLMVGVLPRRGSRIGYGRALAGPRGASILVDVGEDADDARLVHDWVLVHEMIHLTFPSLDRTHRWMEEGLATYLEPLVRARAGLSTEAEAFGDFVTMMANGQPEDGDLGIDRTPTWGRIYWGGALFCFVCDFEIRRRTNGERSLDDALRAILAAGGNNGVQWPIEKAFAIGDAATGLDVLTRTYRAWRAAPVRVDLDGMFRDLGIRRDGDFATLDDRAPLAALRKQMTRR